MRILNLRKITKIPAIRYIIFGTISNVLMLLTFAIFVWAGIAPEWATAVLYPVGIIVSYFGHKNYSFKSTELHSVTAPRYVAAHCVVFATFVGAQLLFYRVVGLNPVAVQLGATAVVYVTLFAILRHGVFRGMRSDSV